MSSHALTYFVLFLLFFSVHILLQIHYPQYMDCTIQRTAARSASAANRLPSIHSRPMSSTVEIREVMREDICSNTIDQKRNKRNLWNFKPKKWRWILEFNKVIFSKLLYPDLKQWIYAMNEVQSFELRNYLIVPLHGNHAGNEPKSKVSEHSKDGESEHSKDGDSKCTQNDDEKQIEDIRPQQVNQRIDWKSMERIVSYFHRKHSEPYDLRAFLDDLGLIDIGDDDGDQKQSESVSPTQRDDRLEDIVLVENNRYFVPFNQSKQPIVPILQRIVEEERKDQRDLNEMEQLLDDDDDGDPGDSGGSQDGDGQNSADKERQSARTPTDRIIDKIHGHFQSKGNERKFKIIGIRSDNIHGLSGNVTDSVSFLYPKSKVHSQWTLEPALCGLDLRRSDIHKAPFSTHFLLGLLRIPFMLFQTEKLLGILQFVQSQRYLNEPIQSKLQRVRAPKSWNATESTNLSMNQCLTQIPLLTLSKIVIGNGVHVPYYDMFKSVGSQIMTLLFSTASTMRMLVKTESGRNGLSRVNLIGLTSKVMNESVATFRKTIESNQMIHYFSPSDFRKTHWRPPRFYTVNLGNDEISTPELDTKGMVDAHYRFINESRSGRLMNQHISSLFGSAASDSKSNDAVFSMMNDLFSSIWYYRFGKMNCNDLDRLFLDCHRLSEWMQIDKSLNLESLERVKVEETLSAETNRMGLTADYALFEYQRSKMRSKKQRETIYKSNELKSALNGLNIELQSAICRFVRNIDYQFHFPSILVAVLDPMATRFEMLYEIGTVVLSTVMTVSVATNCYHLLRRKKGTQQRIKGIDRVKVYRECLLSVAYLSHKCRFHRLHTHILRGKQPINITSEMMAEFIIGIVGAIYLDSNLMRTNKERIDWREGIHIKEVIDFCDRFLPEVVLREDISNFGHLIRSQHQKRLYQNGRTRNGTINDLQCVDRRRRTVSSMASKRDSVKR